MLLRRPLRRSRPDLLDGGNGRKAEGLLFGDTPIFDLGAVQPPQPPARHLQPPKVFAQ
jgi:hypothetical protein